MWRRAARDYLTDFVWYAATGENIGAHGPFPDVSDWQRDECRRYLRGLGVELP